MSGGEARLFPDMAAAPTRRERAEVRAVNEAGQLGLFDEVPAVEVPAAVCAVCGGDHGGECRHGVAVELFEVEAVDQVVEVERFQCRRCGRPIELRTVEALFGDVERWYPVDEGAPLECLAVKRAQYCEPFVEHRVERLPAIGGRRPADEPAVFVCDRGHESADTVPAGWAGPEGSPRRRKYEQGRELWKPCPLPECDAQHGRVTVGASLFTSTTSETEQGT